MAKVLRKIWFNDDGYASEIRNISKIKKGDPDVFEVDADAQYFKKGEDGLPIVITKQDVEEYLGAKKDYKQKRREEYPSVYDQMDMIYKALIQLAGETPTGDVKDYIDTIKAVKDKHPKS